MRRYVIILLCAVFLSGCSNPLQKEDEVTEVTETPVPDTVADTSKSITNPDIVLTFNTFDDTALGATDDTCIRVYSNATSFDSAIIELKYMPNYKRFADLTQNITFKELGDTGYIAVITDEGIGEDYIKKISSNITWR